MGAVGRQTPTQHSQQRVRAHGRCGRPAGRVLGLTMETCMIDPSRDRAIETLRYGGQMAMQAKDPYPQPRSLSELERAELEAESRRYLVQQNRRDMLVATLALGRRYEMVEDAIADARKIAQFLQVEID